MCVGVYGAMRVFEKFVTGVGGSSLGWAMQVFKVQWQKFNLRIASVFR